MDIAYGQNILCLIYIDHIVLGSPPPFYRAEGQAFDSNTPSLTRRLKMDLKHGRAAGVLALCRIGFTSLIAK
jgi:hypothetical protein